MRLTVVLLGIALLLAASVASAGRSSTAAIPENVKANPPAGTYWDEELGVFVFDPPIPIQEPQSNLLNGYEICLGYDNGYLYYLSGQTDLYFAATKFITPQLEGFQLTAILLACYNAEGEPEEGTVRIYTHGTEGECFTVNPLGDLFGQQWQEYTFTGVPFSLVPNPYSPPMASWTIVELDPPLMIDPLVNPEFWVAWDYRPGNYWEAGEKGGYYTVCGFGEPPDVPRFFENDGASTPDCVPCPSTQEYGPWGIRACGTADLEPYGTVNIDIKPTSCPNAFKLEDIGDVCVAIVGGGPEEFDVSAQGFMPETITLTPVGCGHHAPFFKHTGIKDVVSYYEWDEMIEDPCENCTTEGPDEWDDWPMHFRSRDIWHILELCNPGEGELEDRSCHEMEFRILCDRKEPWGTPDGFMTGRDYLWLQIPGEPHSQKGGSEIGLTKVGDADGFSLHQNAPNPFRNETTISFSIPAATHATLTIHDAVGRAVATLVDEDMGAGFFSVNWDGAVPSGVYFCRLEAGDFHATTRMTAVR